MKSLLTGFALVLSMAFAPALPAQANPGHSYMGWTAPRVADHIDCKNFSSRRATKMFKSTGICWVRGHRVNIMTFNNERQQTAYAAMVMALLPKQWFALGQGVFITAKNGNRAAAIAGKNALGSAMLMQGNRDV